MVTLTYDIRNKLQENGFKQVKDGLWMKQKKNRPEFKMYVDLREAEPKTYAYNGDDYVKERPEVLERLYKYIKFEIDTEQMKLDEMYG